MAIVPRLEGFRFCPLILWERMHGLVERIGSLRAAVLGANTSRFVPSASGWGPGSSHEPRSAIPGPALPLVSVDPARAHYHSARDGRGKPFCNRMMYGVLMICSTSEVAANCSSASSRSRFSRMYFCGHWVHHQACVSCGELGPRPEQPETVTHDTCGLEFFAARVLKNSTGS